MQANALVMSVFFGTIILTGLIWFVIDLLTSEDVNSFNQNKEQKFVVWVEPEDYYVEEPPLPEYNSNDNQECRAVIDQLGEDALTNWENVSAAWAKLTASYREILNR